ncbi:MAG: choice-of-anchor B family protein [Thermoleophilaceae bacterium]
MPENRVVPRLALLAAVVLTIGGLIAAVGGAGAADPSKGTVSLDERSSGWDGESYPVGSTVARDACALPTDTVCDHFELNVDIDPAHWETNKGGVEVRIAWESEADDFDLTVYDEDFNEVGSSLNPGTTSERVFINDASGTYFVEINPYQVTDSAYQGGAFVESRAIVGPEGGDVPTEPVSGLDCVDGLAGPFPCENVDLASFLPLDSIGGGQGNDIWGWTDPETGREYALMGKTSGTAFVDITDAEAPVYLGDLPSHQPVETIFNVWRDVKVYENHAFVVSEEPLHGMQVFDLTRLRGVSEPRTWTEDAHYSYTLDGPTSVVELGPDPTRLRTLDNAHNIAINEDSGFAYAIGTSTCGGGGPHMIDIRDPKDPKFAGCVSEDGYTHDTQCVNYDGPDERFHGREICLSSNEDTLTIADVTDKSNPVQLARETYPGASYTHQGWLTEDGSHFLVDDELDEVDEQVEQTTTYIWNVEFLDAPRLVAAHPGESTSIDHNLYTKGDTVFQANYRSGLRVLDASSAAAGELTETGFFDVYPADDEPEFNGAWSNFPYYESGVVVVSGIEQGLFVLRPR